MGLNKRLKTILNNKVFVKNLANVKNNWLLLP